ncbi:MAG: TRAP transporter small permease subunit [Aestuariivita sp.]|uniref:TRAP transporter small permease subunit n=1 Tax=Aestuariivita sp. TaxID=1872407 RepID=UPI003BB1A06F
MIAIANFIDWITVVSGKVLACLMLPLVIFVFANAALRYVFGIGHVWLFEAVGYCFAVLAVGLAGWALKENEHVRVDILYAMLSRRGKAVIDIFGTLFLLGPFVWLMWDRSLPYVQRSWKTGQTSMEISGIPYVWLLKTCLLAFCVLLGLAAVSFLIRAINVLIQGEDA